MCWIFFDIRQTGIRSWVRNKSKVCRKISLSSTRPPLNIFHAAAPRAYRRIFIWIFSFLIVVIWKICFSYGPYPHTLGVMFHLPNGPKTEHNLFQTQMCLPEFKVRILFSRKNVTLLSEVEEKLWEQYKSNLCSISKDVGWDFVCSCKHDGW